MKSILWLLDKIILGLKKGYKKGVNYELTPFTVYIFLFMLCFNVRALFKLNESL